MDLISVRVGGYRTIRTVTVPLSGLVVLVGPNGAGKTNLLEALSVWHPEARGALARGGRSFDGQPPPEAAFSLHFTTTPEGRGPDADALDEFSAIGKTTGFKEWALRRMPKGGRSQEHFIPAVLQHCGPGDTARPQFHQAV